MREGWSMWGDNASGFSAMFEIVMGHVDAETFNRERDKCCDGDPVDESDLIRGYVEFAGTGDDETCQWSKEPHAGWLTATIYAD